MGQHRDSTYDNDSAIMHELGLHHALDAVIDISAQSTRRVLRSRVKQLKMLLPDRHLVDLATRDIVVALDEYVANGGSVKTTHAHAMLLKRAYKWALNQGLITAAQIPYIPSPAPKWTERTGFFTKDELGLLLSAMERSDPNMGLLAKVLAYTGMRPSEAMALRVCDINMKDKTIHIRTSKTYKERLVPIFPTAGEALQAAIAATSGRQAAKLWPFPYQSFTRMWNKVRHELGQDENKDWVPYALRHTFASLSLQNGTEPYKLQRIMGHTTIETTLRYAKLSIRDLQSDEDLF